MSEPKNNPIADHEPTNSGANQWSRTWGLTKKADGHYMCSLITTTTKLIDNDEPVDLGTKKWSYERSYKWDWTNGWNHSYYEDDNGKIKQWSKSHIWDRDAFVHKMKNIFKQ